MTQILKIDFKAPKSSPPLVELDAFSAEAQSIVDIRTCIGKFFAAGPNTSKEADDFITQLQALKPSKQSVTALASQIATGLRPATSEQIQEQLALLVGAFPSSNAPDPMVYSRMLFNEALAARPSAIALTAACSELRRRCQWPPPIADVLKTIREEEVRWQHRFRCASEACEAHEQALAKLQKTRAWLARPDAEKEAERKKRLARMESLKHLLRAGVSKEGRKRK